MKKGQITKNTGIKPRYIRRKADKPYVSPDRFNRQSGNHWDWDDEQFISDLGF